MSDAEVNRRRSGRNRTATTDRPALGELTNKKSAPSGKTQGKAKKQRVSRDESVEAVGGPSSSSPSSSLAARTEVVDVVPAASAPPPSSLASQGPAADSEAAAPNPLHGAAEIPAHLDMPVENVLVLDCDIRDREKPHMVTEYMDEIYKYLKKTERVKAPTMYMQTQADINARMRAILIDWLVEVHLKFKLVPATLYLCVSLIDQYCTANAVQRSKLQLVGVTALLVACKYEEIFPPEVRDCVYITDHAYTRREVVDMEMKMLVFFGYNVTSPTCHQFLVRFLRVGGFNHNTRTAHRAAYFSERCLQEHEMLSYKPSLLAASVVYLASSMDRSQPWTQQLREYTGYTVEQIIPCARQISEHVNKNPITASKRPLHAVRKKFEAHKFMAVAEEGPPVL